MKTLISFFLITLSFLPEPSIAQEFNIQPDAEIRINPPIPQPREEVTATISDFRPDSYGSTISWIIDGNEILQSKNHRSITFRVGESGKNQSVKVLLTKPNGSQSTLEKILRPVYLDLIIEPQTRVPNFYLGRSLPSIGSIINVTSIISTPEIIDTDLIYIWKLNQKMLEGGSVRNREKISFATPRGNDSILSVTIQDLRGQVVASKSILIPSVTPKIYFYEMSPLFGVSQKTISKVFTLSGDNAVIQAEPFYLDSRVYNEAGLKEWKLNNVSFINDDTNPYLAFIKRTGDSGFANLEFHVRDTKGEILQGDEAGIRINY